MLAEAHFVRYAISARLIGLPSVDDLRSRDRLQLTSYDWPILHSRTGQNVVKLLGGRTRIGHGRAHRLTKFENLAAENTRDNRGEITLLDIGSDQNQTDSIVAEDWIAGHLSLGQLPGRLARKWGHPQASAINVAGWIGMATGGLLWPLALIWAFINPSGSQAARTAEAETAASQPAPLRKPSVHDEIRP